MSSSSDLCKQFLTFFSRKPRPVVVQPTVIEYFVIGIEPTGTVSYAIAHAILLTKLAQLGDTEAEIFLPDADVKIYSKDDVIASESLKQVSKLTYIAGEHDCDDFAAKLFGKFAGLVWTNLHALNWFIDSSQTFWYIEPQTGKISEALDTSWQGEDVRFYLGR